MIICDQCKQEVDSLNEVDQCEDCAEAWFQSEMAYYRPIYLAEKAAGLTLSDEEYRADMINAGLGHLVKP